MVSPIQANWLVNIGITGVSFTVMVAGLVVATWAQTPFWTTALNKVDIVSAGTKYDVVLAVPVISVQTEPPSVDFCHLITIPLLPLSVIVPPVVFLHIAEDKGLKVPALLGALTVIKAGREYSIDETPLWTTAL